MAPSDTHRKLTAILCADVAGYSRLMGADEEATIETLTAYRRVFISHIATRRGSVVDAKGDAILAEFSSVVDAVSSAVEIQRELAEINAELPEDRRMDFRIGINLDDVVVKDDVIYGDGVNVAARLESLAEPGGICISRPVHDQVESKLKLEYDFLGEQQVKNIAKPVRAYKVLLEPGQALTRTERALRKLARGWRKGALVAMAAVLVALVAALAWNLYRQSVVESALAAFEKEAAFPLPEKPSIAVLAFQNMSNDPQQEYFSDGLSENIITRLTGLSGLLVIARNSSFKYKGQPVDVRQVGRELGVRFVLEGSVQQAAGQIRINVQLIDAATGNHLWAESYDRQMQDVFAIQDEITEEVVTELAVQLTSGEQARLYHRGTDNIQANTLFLRALKDFRVMKRGANHQARIRLEKALALDPDYSAAYMLLSISHSMAVMHKWSKNYREDIGRAETLAKQALALDESNSGAYAALSFLHVIKKEYGLAIAEGEKAVALNPNMGDAHAILATAFLFSGRPEDAIPMIKTAMRLSPYYPDSYLGLLGLSLSAVGRYESAVVAANSLLERNPDTGHSAHVMLALSQAALGRMDETRAATEKILQANPKFSTKQFVGRSPFNFPTVRERISELLREAGLPE